MVFPIAAERYKLDLKVVLGALNETRFAEIIEERLAMGKCANVFCETVDVPESVKAKAKNQKFFIKGQEWSKVGSELLLFCKGTEGDLSKKQDACY